MHKMYLYLFILLFSVNGLCSNDTLKYMGDMYYVKKDYSNTITCYKKYGIENLNSQRLSRLIISEYQVNKCVLTEKAIECWIKQGAMPNYIQGVLNYWFKSIDSLYVDKLFESNLKKWNILFGKVVSESPSNFYMANKFLIHDQHLRFVEINSRKLVDKETFLRVDSLNMIAIMNYIDDTPIKHRKLIEDILFGVIHHYCGEGFFTKEHFDFFETRILDFVKENKLDIKDYCYFVDKYNVFNGNIQEYGTYVEMDGIPGVTYDMYIRLNESRKRVGYYISVEDQIKFNL